MKWRPGETIGDYYYSLRKEAKRANLSVRTTCVLLTAQLPKEIQGKIKSELAEKENVNEAEGGELIVKIKVLLSERGLPVDKGYRDLGKVEIAEVEPSFKAFESQEVGGKDEVQDILITRRDTNKYVRSGYKPRDARQRFECYICKSRAHGWKVCPNALVQSVEIKVMMPINVRPGHSRLRVGKTESIPLVLTNGRAVLH